MREETQKRENRGVSRVTKTPGTVTFPFIADSTKNTDSYTSYIWNQCFLLFRQKVFSFRPRFFISMEGTSEELELVQRFTFFKQEYYIENSSYLLEGNFSAHRFTLKYNEEVVMSVDKEWFTWGDSYVIDIRDSADALTCICIMLAVDCANADAAQTASSST